MSVVVLINKSTDGVTELEIAHGDSNDFLLNGEKGFLDDSSNCGDSDRGVHYGSDDGLNSDGKLFDNGILVKIKLWLIYS